MRTTMSPNFLAFEKEVTMQKTSERKERFYWIYKNKRLAK